MRKETVDIIGDIVGAINLTFTIYTTVDNGGNSYTLGTCNTLHLQSGFKVTIDAVVYTITEVDKNTAITITGDVLPTADSFEVYPPYYHHGTIVSSNVELAQIKDANNKTPLIFLHEVIEDKFYNKSDNPLERETTLKMFFLSQSNWAKNSTNDHYVSAINPMRSLVYNFINTLNKTRYIADIEDYRIKNHTLFANYLQSGYTEAIFDKNLSGCELNITIPIRPNKCIEC